MGENDELDRMGRQLSAIGRIEKCTGCSCYVDTLREYKDLLGLEGRQVEDPSMRNAEELLRAHPTAHGCLGCNPCYPVAVSNTIAERRSRSEDRGTSLAMVESRSPGCGASSLAEWPSIPGDYVVGNSLAPVAVSTLGDSGLVQTIVKELGLHLIAIVGKTETENLGVDKIVGNLVANPAVRTLILCGKDVEGHRPGATLLALARNGVDGQGRIIDSPGRRPVIRNVSAKEVERFRAQVELIDLVGETSLEVIARRVQSEAAKTRSSLPPWSDNPPEPFEEVATSPPWIPDQAGFFVVLLDRPTRMLVVEHYAYDGRLLATLRGPSAKPLYQTVASRGWITRLDHAAYLGRELTRAEWALDAGTAYVQDAA